MSINNEIEKFSLRIKDSIVLDVGCGTRQYEKYFLQQGNQYIGLDVEESGRIKDNKIADVYYDGINIPFDDNYFDVLICTQVLEHVKDVPKLISEFNRVLKEGGLLFITVPFIWGEHETPYDFRRFTSFGIYLMLENTFTIDKFIKINEGSDALKILLNSEMLHYSNNKKISFIKLKRFIIKSLFYLSFKVLNKYYKLERIYLDNCVIATKNK